MFGGYSFSQLGAIAVTAVTFGILASTVVGLAMTAALPATAAAASVIGFTSTVASVMGFLAGFPAGLKLHEKISDTYHGLKRRRQNPAIRKPRAAASLRHAQMNQKPSILKKLTSVFKRSQKANTNKANKANDAVIQVIDTSPQKPAQKKPGAK